MIEPTWNGWWDTPSEGTMVSIATGEKLETGAFTNWNAGLCKNGKERTFKFSFDRKTTVARANMEKMIDDSLSTGDFLEIDEIYVMIRHATCRHINHTGPYGIHPSKKDRCAVKTAKVDKEATLAKIKAWEIGGKKGPKPKEVKKDILKHNVLTYYLTKLILGNYYQPHMSELNYQLP